MNRKERMQAALSAALNPMHLELTDESHMHNVPAGAESHFNLLVVADAFDGEKPVARHRQINALLGDELRGGLHALAIHAWTPQEWFDKGGGGAPQSPECLGGSKAKD